MQNILGQKIESGMCGIRHVRNRQNQLGFFKESKRGTLYFIRVDTKINLENGQHELLQVKTRVQDHDEYTTFSYEAEIIDYLFSQSSYSAHLSENLKNSAKKFFVELAIAANVSGAPETAASEEAEDEEGLEFLELDGLEEEAA